MPEASLGSIEAQLRSAEQERKKLNDAIFGNGMEGLKARTVRIEEKLDNYLEDQKEFKKDTTDTLGDISEAISSINKELSKLSEEIAGLAKSVQKHIDDKTSHTLVGLIRNTSRNDIILFIVISVLFWVLLHAIIPTDLDIWSVFSGWLGL